MKVLMVPMFACNQCGATLSVSYTRKTQIYVLQHFLGAKCDDSERLYTIEKSQIPTIEVKVVC